MYSLNVISTWIYFPLCFLYTSHYSTEIAVQDKRDFQEDYTDKINRKVFKRVTVAYKDVIYRRFCDKSELAIVNIWVDTN